MEYSVPFIIGLYGLLAWFHIQRALIVLVFLLPTYLIRFTLGPLPTTLLEMLILTTFGVWLIKNRSGLLKNLQFIFLEVPKFHFWSWKGLWIFSFILFFVSSILSMMISPQPLGAIGVWRAYFFEPLLIFCVVITELKNSQQRLLLLCAGIISATLISFYALAQYILEGMRATSVYPFPNAIGLFVGPFAISTFILGLYYSKNIIKPFTAVFFFCASFVMVGGIISAQTESMAGILILCMLGILVWVKGWPRFIGICGMIGGVTFLMVHTSAQLFLIQKLFLKDWSGFVHVSVWKETIHMLQDYWLTGAGLTGFQELFKHYHITQGVEIFLYPHNIVLNFWSELGIYGLISFLLLMISSMALGIGYIRHHNSPSLDRTLGIIVLFSLGVSIIHGLVDVPYFKNDLAVQFWILLGIGFSLYTTQEDLRIT